MYYGRKLQSFGVPVGMVIHYCGVTDVVGSPDLKKKLQDISDDLGKAAENDIKVCSAVMINDEVNLKEWARDYIDEVFNDIQVPALPNSIKKMTCRQTIQSLRAFIVYDYNTRNKKRSVNIKYGCATWKPSFWPDQLWSWETIENFSDITNAHIETRGLKNVTSFFKDVLRMAMNHYELDCDNTPPKPSVRTSSSPTFASTTPPRVTLPSVTPPSVTSPPITPGPDTPSKNVPTPPTANSNASSDSFISVAPSMERQNTLDRLLSVPSLAVREEEARKQLYYREVEENLANIEEEHNREIA